MSQENVLERSSFSLNIMCKNEMEITNAAKAAEVKYNELEKEQNNLRRSINELKNRITVLDGKIFNHESAIQLLEKEIEDVVKESEEKASATKLVEWKITKVKMVLDAEKESVNARYRAIEAYKENYAAMMKAKGSKEQELQDSAKCGEKSKKEELQKVVDELMQSIERKRSMLADFDKGKLQQEIKMLQNRNAAIMMRMRRQIQEAEARYRQRLLEFSDLQKVLEKKNEILERCVQKE